MSLSLIGFLTYRCIFMFMWKRKRPEITYSSEAKSVDIFSEKDSVILNKQIRLYLMYSVHMQLMKPIDCTKRVNDCDFVAEEVNPADEAAVQPKIVYIFKAPSRTPSQLDETPSDLSDAEGYLYPSDDQTKTRISLKLASTRIKQIRALYINTDKVRLPLCSLKHSHTARSSVLYSCYLLLL